MSYHALLQLESVDNVSPGREIEMKDGLMLAVVFNAFFLDFILGEGCCAV